MTILYIAGPMTGIEDLNYPAFREAEKRLREAGYEVLNPITIDEHNTTGKQMPWEWYMRWALRMVLEAEGIAMLPRWQMSRGALLEVQVANAIKTPTMRLEDWLAK